MLYAVFWVLHTAVVGDKAADIPEKRSFVQGACNEVLARNADRRDSALVAEKLLQLLTTADFPETCSFVRRARSKVLARNADRKDLECTVFFSKRLQIRWLFCGCSRINIPHMRSIRKGSCGKVLIRNTEGAGGVGESWNRAISAKTKPPRIPTIIKLTVAVTPDNCVASRVAYSKVLLRNADQCGKLLTCRVGIPDQNIFTAADVPDLCHSIIGARACSKVSPGHADRRDWTWMVFKPPQLLTTVDIPESDS